MYGTTWCQDCKRAKQFFGEHRVPYAFVDVDQDEDGLRLVERLNDGNRVIPTIVFADGAVLVEPSNVALAEKLGLQTHADCPYYDLVVVGGGPAGLTAALYAAREGIETLVVERSAPGGQAGVTEQLDNYPGFPDGISGADFADRLVAQCRRFGVEILSAAEVTRVTSDGQYRAIGLANGDEVRAQAVLLVPGATYRRLGIAGEEDFIGAGVHFCATCDGPFYRGQEMLVVGAGNSAAEGALFLARFASRVIIAVRGTELSAGKLAMTKVLGNPRIEVRPNTEVKEFRGDTKLRTSCCATRPPEPTKISFPAPCSSLSGWSPTRSSCAVWSISTRWALSAPVRRSRRASRAFSPRATRAWAAPSSWSAPLAKGRLRPS